MTCVLLVDPKSSPKHDVRGWLNQNGLVAWHAQDLSHALEELSDFTVRQRPDVVMLEVAFLEESFDSVRSALHSSTEGQDVMVLGLSGRGVHGEASFVSSMEQIHSRIRRQTEIPA